jgi:hypothetical protein
MSKDRLILSGKIPLTQSQSNHLPYCGNDNQEYQANYLFPGLSSAYIS